MRPPLPGWVYIAQLSEHIRLNESVFKTGRSCDLMIRMGSYPNGSALAFAAQVPDCIAAEAALLAAFRARFVHRRDIGAEYFEGPGEHVWEIAFTALAGLNVAPGRQPWKARRVRPMRDATPPTTPSTPDPTPTSLSSTRPTQQRSCADVVGALLAVRGSAYAGHDVHAAQVTAEATALAQSLGWTCGVLTINNVISKVTLLTGVKPRMLDKGRVLRFPPLKTEGWQRGVDEMEPDRLAAFLKECCVMEDGAVQPTAALLHAYNAWAGRDNTMSDKAFPAAMRAKGVQKQRASPLDGVRTMCFMGIRLNDAVGCSIPQHSFRNAPSLSCFSK